MPPVVPALRMRAFILFWGLAMSACANELVVDPDDMGDETGTGDGGEVERPPGWFPDSHEQLDPPNADVVFPDHVVNEITLRISSDDWNAMQADIDKLLTQVGNPSADMQCAGKPAWTPCEVFPSVPGVCLETSGEMSCVLDVFSSCTGKVVGDACTDVFEFDSTCQGTAPFLQCLASPGEQACTGKVEGDTCKTQNNPGTCVADEASLACEIDLAAAMAIVDPCTTADVGAACKLPIAEGRCETYADRRYCQVDGYASDNLQGVGNAYSAKMFSRDPKYFPVDVEFNGRVWTKVGFRYKGNNSLARSVGIKRPFVLNFDYYEDTNPEINQQRFYGFRKVSFHNGVTDPSFLRQRAASEVFRAAGVAAPLTAFYVVRLAIDDGPAQLLGVHAATEYPAGPLLRREFGEDEGNLYKPDGKGAHFRDYVEVSFHRKNHTESTDYGDVQAFIAALHASQTDRTAWRNQLDDTMDMRGFIRYYATNTAMDNWDTYGQIAHNFYLYSEADTGRFSWIAWDFDLAMNAIATPMSLSLVEYGGKWPLLQAVARDPAFAHEYHLALRHALDIALDRQANSERWVAWADLLRPHVAQELGTTQWFDDAVAQLQEHLFDQWATTDAYLRARGF